jgi:hypothetical protein
MWLLASFFGPSGLSLFNLVKQKVLMVLISESQELLEIRQQTQSSCRMSTSLIWHLVYLAEWGLSGVSADWNIHSANRSRSSGLPESSHCSFDWCSFHKVCLVKFLTLLESVVQGENAATSHSFRNSTNEGGPWKTHEVAAVDVCSEVESTSGRDCSCVLCRLAQCFYCG